MALTEMNDLIYARNIICNILLFQIIELMYMRIILIILFIHVF